MKICLDTNAYSALLRGNEALRDLLACAEEIIVPAAVVGESVEGFAWGTRFAQNLMLLEAFLDRPSVRFQAADRRISERFGHMKAALRRKGRPIPINDIWIAATAFEAGAQLVSYDRHFDEIEGVCRVAPG